MKRWAFRIEVVVVGLMVAAGAVTSVWTGVNMLRRLF